jgi:hypothetical protein
MGWTHDYRDVSRKRGFAARGIAQGVTMAPGHRTGSPPLGIPRILRRRARWMSARLRQARSE